MAIYVDVMFLRELLVDGAILLTTAWVRHLKPRPWRVLTASAVGACYVVLMLFPQLSFLFTLIVKVGMSFFMVWIAFGFSSLQNFLRNVAAFYAVNFVAAGAVLGIYYLFMQGSGEVWRTITFVNGSMHVELKMGLFYLIAAFCIGLYIYRTVLTQKRERELVQTHLAEVKITIGDRTQTCVGLIDTGNQLYDPLTRTPVMVMEASLWQEDLPESWLNSIRDAQVDRLVAGMDQQPYFIWQDRLRLVPFRGVNRGSQFMLAIKPDAVEITREGQVFETRKVLIGLDGGKLTSDGAYRAIIHPSMVQQ
ncbi:sigma-E processing peptidase SpoIIGA [Paenibacillus sp. FSL H8-0548]|uniref:sigma-E processing peptidase SpoIIGA n=1 Tax=Paenibacillus sp. FSL H8-0548 TaxID=1920422 RepID=UPI00096DE5CF|nr:sigma-E processing peptidase SpoIIGA [Paenibacillus sp. FSL H8-0548]OMF22769.1 sigma-E processing peptidase SpoIIGA [Paenibacillus sp. FSL H8-0548]